MKKEMMKKTLQKWFGRMITMMVLIFSSSIMLLSDNASADPIHEEYIASGEGWYIDLKGNLVADYTCPGYNVDLAPWSEYKNQIKTAKVALKGYRYFHALFMDYRNLESVDFTGTDFSSVETASEMFAGCVSLKEVRELDLSGIEDLSELFYNCTNLIEADLSPILSEYPAAKNLSGMFDHCSALRTVSFKEVKTLKLEDVSELFRGDESLENLDLSGLCTANVKDMQGMFAGCHSLKVLDLSNLDTSNVLDMSGMFLGCDALQHLNISTFDTAKVTNMSNMFWMCSGNFDVSRFDTSNVTDMGGMFYHCRSEVIDVSLFNTSKVTNMREMFCGTIAGDIDVSHFDTSNVTDMRCMFNGAAIETIDLSSFCTSNVKTMACMFTHCLSLKRIDLSCFDMAGLDMKGDPENDSILFWMDSLEDITLPADMPFKINLVWYNGYFFDENGDYVTESKMVNYPVRYRSIPFFDENGNRNAPGLKNGNNEVANSQAEIVNLQSNDDEIIIPNNDIKTDQTIDLQKYRYSFKYRKLKKKAKKFRIRAIYNNGSVHGRVSFKVTGFPRGGKKYIKVDKRGNVTLKKKAKKGVYQVTISLAGTDLLNPASNTVTISIR
ncbi:MAG: DUF285 domain-containing protein [Lachnospiraceae bacterium]|nr:DUF285 domain-containing protein [Lachnospiraceae bacterium]